MGGRNLGASRRDHVLYLSGWQFLFTQMVAWKITDDGNGPTEVEVELSTGFVIKSSNAIEASVFKQSVYRIIRKMGIFDDKTVIDHYQNGG